MNRSKQLFIHELPISELLHPSHGPDDFFIGRTCRTSRVCVASIKANLSVVQERVRRHLPAWWVPEVPSCAVVGSSSSLLARSYGSRIDEADIVIRVNNAPTTGYEEHVGQRTTVRVGVGATLPSITPNVTGVLLCEMHASNTPCWKDLAQGRRNETSPRFHPNAWHVAKAMIHRNTSRCWRQAGCYPTAGAMAVLFALRQCSHVNVFGFGAVGKGGADDGGPSSDSEACVAKHGEKKCARAQHCDKYHDDRKACDMTYRGVGRDNSTALASPYMAEGLRAHDYEQEWAWLDAMHRARRLVWFGRPASERTESAIVMRRYWLRAQGRVVYDESRREWVTNGRTKDKQATRRTVNKQ
jgi:hypothetical protein